MAARRNSSSSGGNSGRLLFACSRSTSPCFDVLPPCVFWLSPPVFYLLSLVLRLESCASSPLSCAFCPLSFVLRLLSFAIRLFCFYEGISLMWVCYSLNSWPRLQFLSLRLVRFPLFTASLLWLLMCSSCIAVHLLSPATPKLNSGLFAYISSPCFALRSTKN